MRLITTCADNDLISTSFQVETKWGLCTWFLSLSRTATRGKRWEREREREREGERILYWECLQTYLNIDVLTSIFQYRYNYICKYNKINIMSFKEIHAHCWKALKASCRQHTCSSPVFFRRRLLHNWKKINV